VTLLEIETPGGRKVQLSRLHLLGTLDWRTASPDVSERNLQELLTSLFGTVDLPVVVRPGMETSWVTCIGSFTSQALHSQEHWRDYSFPVVCWFTGIELPAVRELVAAGLRGVEWEVHARDYNAWAGMD
jgi:hypothetical protein